MGSIPGLGRYPGGRNGNPLQYSHQENPMDIGASRLSPWGRRELDTTQQLCMHAKTNPNGIQGNI